LAYLLASESSSCFSIAAVPRVGTDKVGRRTKPLPRAMSSFGVWRREEREEGGGRREEGGWWIMERGNVHCQLTLSVYSYFFKAVMT